MQRGLLTVALLAVLAALPSASATDVDEFDAAMRVDDECAVGGDAEACALSQLQLRATGKTETAAASLEGAAETDRVGEGWSIWPWDWFKHHYKARDHPQYCSTLPAGLPPNPYCDGAKTCSCQSYCKHVRGKDWGWDPNCCGCSSLLELGSGAAPVVPLQPKYCATGAGEGSPACAAEFSSCTCAGHCATDVPVSGWSWDATCCGCAAALLQVQQVGSQRWSFWPWDWGKHNKGGDVAARKHPQYCDNMPNDGVDSPWCSGGNTCQCQGYCQSAATSSWGWDPNCCGCGKKSGAAEPAPAPAPTPTDAEPAPAPVPSEGGLKHPAYCQNQPTGGYVSPYCEGKSTCGCQSYCTAAVLPSQWGWDPNCCGCGAAEKEVADKDENTTDVPQEGLTHPAYCDSIPSGSSPDSCSGSNSCKCKPYCLKSVVPSAWRWDPQCCGCSSDSDDKPSHDHHEGGSTGSGEGSGTPREQPTYCETTPTYLNIPWCAAGVKTCSCQAYCTISVSPTLWGADPGCCGCSASSAPVQHSRKKPYYCSSTAASKPWWCESATCGCQGYCTMSVAPSNWGWDPNCCGCSTALDSNVKVLPSSTSSPKAVASNASSLLDGKTGLPSNAQTVRDEDLELMEDGRWRKCAAYGSRTCSGFGPNHKCVSWGSRKCVRWYLLEEGSKALPTEDGAGAALLDEKPKESSKTSSAEPSEEEDLELLENGSLRKCASYGSRTCMHWGMEHKCVSWGSRKCLRWYLLEKDDRDSAFFQDKWRLMQEASAASVVRAAKPAYCQWLTSSSSSPLECSSLLDSGCECSDVCKHMPSAHHIWSSQCCGCSGAGQQGQ